MLSLPVSRQLDGPSLNGLAAAEVILGLSDRNWHIHRVGIEGGEDLLQPLETGMVLAYGPGFWVGADAYYLEDVVPITDSAHRGLSANLPYWASDIEEMMAR
ncbi:MAG: hypothetical protein ACKVIN_09500 [Longimicrobiales bacterium]